MNYLFLAVFIIVSAVHLYGSYKDDRRIRNISKGFILPALVGYYALSVPEPSWLVIAALLTSWLGDVLLIPKGVGWFTAGGISFMASHFLFIMIYLPQVSFALVPWWLVAIIAAVYLTVVVLVFRALKPYLPKPLFWPMLLYLMINGGMNMFALMQLLCMPCAATAVTFIGAVMFFISDSTLFFVRFHKKDVVWKRHFIVMLTYIAAELLITQGIIMLAVR